MFDLDEACRCYGRSYPYYMAYPGIPGAPRTLRSECDRKKIEVLYNLNTRMIVEALNHHLATACPSLAKTLYCC